MVVAPGRIIDSFLSIPDAESLPLYRMVLKLACGARIIIACCLARPRAILTPSHQSAGLRQVHPSSVSQWPLARLVQPPGPRTHLHH